MDVLALANFLTVHPDLRNEMDESHPPWIDTTTGRAGGVMVAPENIPNSWSSAEAVKFDGGGASTATRIHQQQKKRHEHTPVYRYTPLSDGSGNIRILHLLPGQQDDPVRTRLESCSIANPPSYEAVSHAWGSRSDNAVVILCDSEVEYNIEVPRSLYEALKQLRHHSDSRSIWADAICMNQTDDEEKSHQVRLMRKIYQRAMRVVIWLGNDHDTGCGASSLFNIISEMNRCNFLAVPPPEDREFWVAFERLYRSPWFWRVWCLQEAVLAPSAQVMLGRYSTPWKHIGFAAAWLRDLPSQVLEYHNNALTGVHNACLIYGLSHTNQRRQRISFLQLLALTRPFVATDFRDKIYGILGIPTTDSDPDAGESFLQPDYTKSLSEVYIDCSLAIISGTQSLRILSYVQHEQLSGQVADIPTPIEADHTLVNVPSWVPRWHQYFARTLAPSELERKTFEVSASINFDSMAKIEVRGLKLITHGAQIARVKIVSRVIDNTKTRRHNSAEMANEVWMEISEHLKASSTNQTELLYALSALLTAGKDWFGGIIEDRQQHFADFLALMYNPALLSDGGFEVERNQALGESKQTDLRDRTISRRPNMLQDSLFRPRTNFVLPPVTKTGRSHCFQEAMRGACTWRRLIVTDSGHVGLGPQVTEPGDVVCILKGAIMPLLLRPEADGDSFKLVGEAYIQGMMFGEYTISQVEQIVLSDKPFVDPVV